MEEVDVAGIPIKASQEPKNAFGGKLKSSRKKSGGPLKSVMPDMKSIVGVGSKTRSRDTSNKPYDNDFVLSPFAETRTATEKQRFAAQLQNRRFKTLSQLLFEGNETTENESDYSNDDYDIEVD